MLSCLVTKNLIWKWKNPYICSGLLVNMFTLTLQKCHSDQILLIPSNWLWFAWNLILSRYKKNKFQINHYPLHCVLVKTQLFCCSKNSIQVTDYNINNQRNLPNFVRIDVFCLWNCGNLLDVLAEAFPQIA